MTRDDGVEVHGDSSARAQRPGGKSKQKSDSREICPPAMYMHAHAHTHVHTGTRTRTHAHAHTRTHIHARAQARTNAHAHTCTCTHVHTHTHTQAHGPCVPNAHYHTPAKMQSHLCLTHDPLWGPLFPVSKMEEEEVANPCPSLKCCGQWQEAPAGV